MHGEIMKFTFVKVVLRFVANKNNLQCGQYSFEVYLIKIEA